MLLHNHDCNDTFTMTKREGGNFKPKIDNLVCTDIIFALLNHTFNKTELIVDGVDRESRSLSTDIDRRNSKERIEVLVRAYMAKELTIELM